MSESQADTLSSPRIFLGPRSGHERGPRDGNYNRILRSSSRWTKNPSLTAAPETDRSTCWDPVSVAPGGSDRHAPIGSDR